jgi:hypothetical protein
MIRNLKTLGVALAAVFALGAVVASAASAQQAFLTSDGPLKELKGTELAEGANRLTALGTFTHCTASYTGNVEGSETTHGTTFKVVPTYTNCKSTVLKVNTDVAMNGCFYVFHLKETKAADTYNTLATLICEGTNKPVVTITAPGGNCVITITPNAAGYPGLTALDTTNGEIDLKEAATGISVDATGAGCPETGENKPASLDAEVTVQGINSTGGTTEIGISELGDTTSHV